MDKNQIKLVHHKANDIYKEYNDEDSIPETYRDISNIPNRMFKNNQLTLNTMVTLTPA